MSAPAAGRTARRAWHRHVMGMPVSVHVLGGPAGDARADGDTERAVTAVYEELRRLDLLLSTYRPDSEVSRLADGAISLAQCSREVREVMDLCDLASQLTRGAFDARRPLPGGGLRLDPTGLAKGWMVERAAAPLRSLPGADFYVNAGGDLLASVVPGHPPLRIGIEDPLDRARLVTVVEIRDGGVATSGTAARGPHIWHPHTGAPANALASVTVAGPTLTLADVLATAVFVEGADGAAWAAELGYEVVVVHRDGRAERTLPAGVVSEPTPRAGKLTSRRGEGGDDVSRRR
ncbi:FAD:protein FMN transferase [Georgenia yuyongxinii]|uniref:FAD:protein FMN transferase n=1 Tax=Georgenia yuyongxinii TaxID=2589797 RepID=A0A552WKT7_9MICO|nr:FAD:protein FMN transferase [Georgenia yuyongxinii]TRW43368.1 FAD:protein FMN transferase [Georgenia yuyongxinii]